jgi:hypothetical protein
MEIPANIDSHPLINVESLFDTFLSKPLFINNLILPNTIETFYDGISENKILISSISFSENLNDLDLT